MEGLKKMLIWGVVVFVAFVVVYFYHFRLGDREVVKESIDDTEVVEGSETVDSVVESAGGYDNYIVFTRGLILNEIIDSVEVNRGSIWVVDPDNHESSLQEIVVGDGSANLMPAWSPDKTKIVFASNRGREASSADTSPFLDLWIVDLEDEFSLKQVFGSEGHDWTPAWSPDGSKIVFASTAGSDEPDVVSNLDIWMVDADGENPLKIADNGAQDEDPVFSADGKTIYYVAEEDDCYALWEVEIAKKKAKPLLDADGSIVCGEDPSLSPDGQELYYWGNQNGQLQAFNFSTKEISFLSYDAIEPWIGPDGGRFVYVVDLDFEASGDLYVSSVDGEDPIQITSGGMDMFPRWRP